MDRAVLGDLPGLAAGAPPERARAAVVLLHGRGASASSMRSLAEALAAPDLAWVLPEAPGNTWYPLSFLAPFAANEPALSASLAIVDAAVAGLGQRGVPAARVVLMGFSQGGCLALEYAARHAQRYGGLVGLSAGLIGPPGTPRAYAGALDGTPTLLACDTDDPHVPAWRVKESARVLESLGAAVDMRLVPGLGHAVDETEIAQVAALLAGVGQQAP